MNSLISFTVCFCCSKQNMMKGSVAYGVMKVHATEADMRVNHIENLSQIISILTRKILGVIEEN